jgi:hypothetical protein
MEFRKFKKQTLIEEVIETSNENLIDNCEAKEEVKNGNDIYREAILKAVAEEDDAINTYDAILKLEEQADKEAVDLFHDMIIHIKDEEKAHFQMLTEGLSKFPGFDVEKELEKAKQEESALVESVELKEEVAANRTYNVWDIDNAVQKYVDLTDSTYDQISDLFYRADDEIEAEEAQQIINTIKDTLHLTDNIVTLIENELNKTLSPAEERIEDFRSDIDADINTLKSILASDELHTYAASARLTSIIAQLDELKTSYHGEKDIGWKPENHITGTKPTKSIIS